MKYLLSDMRILQVFPFQDNEIGGYFFAQKAFSVHFRAAFSDIDERHGRTGTALFRKVCSPSRANFFVLLASARTRNFINTLLRAPCRVR